jgi:prepilin-type N-terminal cleavage/methylation domain-containing protein
MTTRRNDDHRRSSFILHPSSFPRAFTLVEMLTVIVIMGILAALITAAVIHARASVKVSAVRMEISQIQKALEAYKLKYGDYPPDFTDQTAVVRHLQNAFPRYFETLPAGAQWGQFVTDIKTAYGIDPSTFDPATALVFWLGGLPATVPAAGQPWIPAGFSADKQRPFSQGTSRENGTPFYAFVQDRLKVTDSASRPLRYIPPSMEQSPAPYVYFRARNDSVSVAGVMVGSGRLEFGATNASNKFVPFSYSDTATSVCVPYMNGQGNGNYDTPATVRPWAGEQPYQIISAGLTDGLFGDAQSGAFRNITTGEGISQADFDNIASCTAKSKIEDEMPQ